ncbi:MAG: TetR/AcrR family transcriptional regulator [Bacteroidales bacterium]|jgi:AcrR family transcriptional regulator
MKESKEHIIIVASRLFMQKSYKEVTMSEIVKETGLSKGAFYYYFKSKEELFSEVLTYFFLNVTELTYDKYSSESLHQFYHDVAKGINSLTGFYIEKFKGSIEVGELSINYFTLMFDAIKLFPELRLKIVDLLKNENKKWREVIGTAREKGEIKSVMSDEQLAKIFVSISDGVGMHLIIQGVPFDKIAEPLVELWDKLYEQIKV